MKIDEKTGMILLGIAALGVAAYAMMRSPSVITKDKPVFVDRPFMVEVPTALSAPQPNVYSFYNVDAGMNIAPGAINLGQPQQNQGYGGSSYSDWDAYVSEQYAQETGG